MSRRTPRLDLAAVAAVAAVADYIVPFAIRVASDLGIADHLADGERTADELAAATGSHAGALARLLRVLARKGVFAETAPGTFALTPMAEVLRTDHPMSLRHALSLVAADLRAWAHFDHSVKTGEPAFEHVHGMRVWDYFARHPGAGERFDRGMAVVTQPELRATLAAYDWSVFEHVADVGGGNGAFLAGVLARCPRMRGTLFDLPHVIAGAADVLVAAGVAERCTLDAGSFFDRVPAGADAYVLKRILYGWDDERAVAILRAVRAAMPPTARLLIVEPVVLLGPGSRLVAMADLMMLAVDGGRARTPDELGALLAQAELRVARVIPTFMFAIVEATAA